MLIFLLNIRRGGENEIHTVFYNLISCIAAEVYMIKI